MIHAARGGGSLLVILLVIGVLYFTNAGTWLWTRVTQLDENCYTALSTSRAASVAPTVCGGVAKAIAAMEDGKALLQQRIQDVVQRFMGNSGLHNLNGYMEALKDKMRNFNLSSDQLSQLLNRGPNFSIGQSIQQQFKDAMDSFAVSQYYLQGNNASQALPWLQQGAAQPEGFGVMSQLTLGNLYAQGGNGVDANPQIAEYYLNEARNSISTLSGNGSPQAQQMLQNLPASPQAMIQNIEQILRQLQVHKN